MGTYSENPEKTEKSELLEKDDNIGKCMGNSNGKFTAKQRKIQVAQMVQMSKGCWWKKSGY